jgi:hypothetical protein
MSRIACPYCCTIQTFPETTICKQCGLEVPEKYIRAARIKPPVYLVVVGMTSHGKTTFIHSMIHSVDNLGKIARGAFLDALDDKTIEDLRAIRGQIAERKVTESTQKNAGLQEPLVFSLKSFMTDDRHTLVLYDLAGESFSDRAEIQRYAEPLKLAHTVWFVVSLHDLEHENSEYGTIADLFNIYITGMERVGANPRGRKLHVMYAKADKLTNRLDREILEYIRDDPYTNLAEKHPRDLREVQFDQDDYLYKLDETSSRLREFTEYEVPGGISFINMVEDYQMELSFSINTAIGRDQTPNNRMIDYESYRVIDPLIWALREGATAPLGPQAMSRATDAGHEVALILDTGFSSRSKVYGSLLPSQFFSALSDLGKVKTFYMGTSTPMTTVGMEPKDDLPRQETMAFIGPILDQLGDEARVLVITCQTIRDILDFHDPSWHERLGIVSFDNLYEVRRGIPWPRCTVFDRSRTAQEQVKDIVKKLFLKPI